MDSEEELKTPKQWLPTLINRYLKKLDGAQKLNDHVTSHQAPPTGAAGLEETWLKFACQSILNCPELVISSVSERLKIIGYEVTDDEDATEALRRLWLDSQMDVTVSDLVYNMLLFGTSYGIVENLDSGVRVATDSPLYMYAAPDPLKPYKARAALRMWKDSDYNRVYAAVWCEGSDDGHQLEVFWRKDENQDIFTANAKNASTLDFNASDWQQAANYPPITSALPVPIVIFNNFQNYGEFERHLGLLDRINTGILSRLTVANLQAFRRVVIAANFEAKDTEDNAENPADHLDKAPGAIWTIDTADAAAVKELGQADIRPLLEATRDDLRDFAAVTRTPLTAFLPDSVNQSAEAAALAREGVVFKAEDRKARFTPPFTLLLRKALNELGYDDKATVRISWAPSDRVTLHERYAAAVQARAAGVADTIIFREILGFDDEKIAMINQEKAMDALLLPINDPNAENTAPPRRLALVPTEETREAA